jgi:hypothetical protein
VKSLVMPALRHFDAGRRRLLLPTESAGAAELVPCFTPGQDCSAVIVAEISGARSELLVQAYGFTSAPIVHAPLQPHAAAA